MQAVAAPRVCGARAALAISSMAVLLAGTAAAPAAQADTIIPFTDWHVGGSLGVKKLHQRIQLPAASRFNGNANLTQGTISGSTTIPDFTTTVRVLVVPTEVALSVREVAPTTGTLSLNPDGTVTTDVTVKSDLRIRRLRLGLLSVPAGANCHTS
ncbi:MAG: hypothetical protein GEU88_06915, partial [Solirubrobacterales bacterium]|nr:hypothetical protein [Solirubrobacterales bacterium]